MDRELFKIAYSKNLIDMGLGDPESLESVTDAVLAGLEGTLEKAALLDLVKAVPGAVRALGSGAATGAKYLGLAAGGAVAVPVAAGLGIGALSGALRSDIEALDDDTPGELREEEVADRYARLADTAEARAKTLELTRKQRARRAGRPVL